MSVFPRGYVPKRQNPATTALLVVAVVLLVALAIAAAALPVILIHVLFGIGVWKSLGFWVLFLFAAGALRGTRSG